MKCRAHLAGRVYSIEFAPAVVKMMQRHRQNAPWKREKGGLLFATASAGEADIISIIEASPPHRLDKTTRCSIELNHGRCQSEVTHANSKGLAFVGCWHTHAELKPSISGIDIRSITKNLGHKASGLNRMLAVIVGIRRGRDGISVYLVDAAGRLIDIA